MSRGSGERADFRAFLGRRARLHPEWTRLGLFVEHEWVGLGDRYHAFRHAHHHINQRSRMRVHDAARNNQPEKTVDAAEVLGPIHDHRTTVIYCVAILASVAGPTSTSSW